MYVSIYVFMYVCNKHKIPAAPHTPCSNSFSATPLHVPAPNVPKPICNYTNCSRCHTASVKWPSATLNTRPHLLHKWILTSNFIPLEAAVLNQT